jgi:hypothetical protein
VVTEKVVCYAQGGVTIEKFFNTVTSRLVEFDRKDECMFYSRKIPAQENVEIQYEMWGRTCLDSDLLKDCQ